MANLFAITAASNSVLLNPQRQGEAAFTVSNVSGRPLRGRAILAPENPAAAGWLSVDGAVERDFVIAGVQQFMVNIAVALDAPVGSYPFRLDMVDVANPDETLTQGPTVTFVVPTAPPPPPPKKPFPWWIIAVIVGVLVVGGIVAFLIFRNVDVPNVVGRPLTEARQALDDASLTVGTTTDRATGSVAPDVVLEQNPAAGQSVRRNSPVDVVVEAPRVSVPNVVGQAQAAAQQNLTAAGLRVGTVAERVTGAGPGAVVDQNPRAGDQVVRNTAVNLGIEAPRVTVPNVQGRPRSEAEQAIRNASLRVGAITFQGTLRQNPNTIVDQNPNGGQAVLRNTAVNLFIEADRIFSGQRTLPDNNSINLENGSVGTGGNNDIRLDANIINLPPSATRTLEVVGNARLARAPNGVDRLGLCRAALTTAPIVAIEINGLDRGDRICVRTRDNHIAELTLVNVPRPIPFPSSGQLIIDIVTWAN